jgi:hypothetical protein
MQMGFCRMYGALRTGAGGNRIIGNVAICLLNYTASNNIIYLLTAVGLSPGGSTHLHTNNRENNTNNNRTTQITNNVEECGPCPVFATFYPGICLTTEEKARKTTVRLRETSVRLIKTSVRVQYTYYQDTHSLQNRHKHTHTHTHYKTI